ncbi:MAG TPA: hypothetical protein VMT18_00930 [Planctomycetota bacterium]|nr:hypothetical protein [Planctomycetota bacterium]
MDPRRFVRRLPLVTLIVCVAWCLSALGGPRVRAAAQPADDPAPADLSFGELQEQSAQWLGRRVRFTFQFESSPPVWNPYLTRFGTQDYVGAVGWGDDQFLWLADEFDAPGVLVFARRGTPAAKALAEANPYARFEVVGQVSQLFLGLPWIELESAERLPQETGEGAILHASRALRAMQAGHWSRALDDLARAEISNLPDAARAELARLRAVCEAERQARKLPILPTPVR